MQNNLKICLVLSLITFGFGGSAKSANNLAMEEKNRWVEAKFQAISDSKQKTSGLLILSNHRHQVSKNSRNGKPLKIGSTEYLRGIACHANSKIVVRLPSAGKTFVSNVGVDSNNETRPGGGSVIFSVDVKGREVFRSSIMSEGTDPVVAEVNLGGVNEFIIRAGDAGSRSDFWDQADWAEAYVITEEDKKLYLDELEIIKYANGPYTTDPPFSFRYGERDFRDICRDWTCKRSTEQIDDGRTRHIVTYLDPATGLEVSLTAIEYNDYPTVEWLLMLKNNSTTSTPIISNVLPIDTMFLKYSEKNSCQLHHHTGDIGAPNSYQPHKTELEFNSPLKLDPGPGGRPSDMVLPYFNLESNGFGLILAIGWPGQWSADFTNIDEQGIQIRAGQELTNFTLYPGEEVRTPLIVVQFWEGDHLDSQNIWRKWMVEYNMPRDAGKVTPVQCSASSHTLSESGDKAAMDAYRKAGITLDYWWIDAGWYTKDGWGGWEKTGTWEVDKTRYPNGIRAVSDHAHSINTRLILWFEPERVMPDTWLYDKHPEWLFKEGLDWPKSGVKLLDLGNPKALTWLIEHTEKMLKDEGVDLYRLDFNANPLPPWRANDADDRQGISEIHYVTAFLTFLDELSARNPNLLIDNCASGGRRNDLETMRRSIPLWRSDYTEPLGKQCHTYGLAYWLPYQGTAAPPNDIYSFRSGMNASIAAGLDVSRNDLDWKLISRNISQWREVAEYYLGDYYPLSPYTTEQSGWIAWQFDRPDLDEGMVQAFCRKECPIKTLALPLRGLDNKSEYTVRNFDENQTINTTGAKLMAEGLTVRFTTKPDACLIKYKKIKK